MRYQKILISFVILLGFVSISVAQDESLGLWKGEIESPGGSLVFGLKLTSQDDVLSAYLLNGPEIIKVPNVTLEAGQLRLEIPHYDSHLDLRLDRDTKVFAGDWKKTRGKDNVSSMKVRLSRPQVKERKSVSEFLGKWQVNFSSGDDPAVAIIHGIENDETRCHATFRTTTGDYRFLSGEIEDDHLRLSVFDGAHAFLFHARITDTGELKGDFWSSLSWHETWTATRGGEASMPDAFAETTWQAQDLGAMKFPNLEGEPTSLNDRAFTGKPRLIHVFGSWCPNCHDAGLYLGQLQEKYGDDLSVLGLAFELTGDFERDAKQVRLFHEHHGTDYPVLIAGMADKKLASEAIPFLDRVRSYPTTIFVDAKGEVVGIHTGFNGPATGEAYEKLKLDFESRIDGMIKDWKTEK